VEIGRGTNALDPRDDVPQVTISLERGRSMVLDGVNFGSGSATLLPQSMATLEKAYAALAAKPAARVEIAGYTDNVGSVVANERLSLRRAESVKAWLVKRGIAGSRLTTVGMGPASPIAPNATEEGRAKNRRIEFHVK
jgi:outer membrane protein OmpA-like peptidoglycan-associated protein